MLTFAYLRFARELSSKMVVARFSGPPLKVDIYLGLALLEASQFALIVYILNIIQNHIMLYVTYLFELFSINIFLISVFIIYTV